MQYALLGELQFELLAYFEGLEGRLASDYAEHARIEGKPRLQWIADKLDEWTIRLKFHHRYCDPERELARLKQAKGRHAPLQFVLANGEYKGDFVITDLGMTAEHTDTNGRLIAVEASVSLKEYVEPPRRGGFDLFDRLAAPAVTAVGKLLPPNAQKLLPGAAGLKQARGALSQASGAAREALLAYRTATELTAAAKQFSANPLGAIERLGRAAPALDKLGDAAGRLGTSLGPLQGVLKDVGPVIASAGAIATEATQARSLLNGLSTGNVSGRIDALEGNLSRVGQGLAGATPALSRLAGRVTLRRTA